ncbi:MAG TPA: low temperature requirement protein A [Gemmatimonadota bacterium]|nr:low temperature requirement protein A [Gemmatimonadota bacterium]
MQPRSPDEEHRAATPLELFFDLVFVVAIAAASGRLHHAVAQAHVAEGLLSYGMVFFAIWWAWMNFTWFASAYDTDDVPYRLATFLQLTGSLILAAGVPRAFDAHDFTITTFGYVVMRLALVGQWLRAARSDPPRRGCAHRYALGVSLCQAGWVSLLFVPRGWAMPGFVALVVAELLVPVWAERACATTWHPGHIAERYGLFTIIVLGESILAASFAIQAAIQAGDVTSDLTAIIVGGLLIVFAMWWLYFARPTNDLLTSLPRAFVWGYGHYAIFASAAAVGAGLGVAVDHATRHAEIGSFGAGAAVAVPVAIYLLGLWALHVRLEETSPAGPVMTPIVAFLVLLTPWTGQAIPLTGLLVSGLLAVKLVKRHRETVRAGHRPRRV